MKIMMLLVLSTMTLTISLNNVILLLNFISMVGIIGYLLLITSFMNLTLLILLVYASLISLLFLVNGLMWMDCFNYRLWVSGIVVVMKPLKAYHNKGFMKPLLFEAWKANVTI